MVKTHLPAHMDSVRQKMRPKHQLLVLKCYPRLPKNSTADVRPNGSELSYLLYYASTRRSKLQKVGSFLENKTAHDLSHSQSTRVLVTLQILTALLQNKSVGEGSGFVLIAPYVLRIVREVLQYSSDISLIEATLATWDVFCQRQDQATLKADHEYRELYEDVVHRYAKFARREEVKKVGKSMQQVAIQDVVRLREAGLVAMKSILRSGNLESESGRQLDVLVPAILSNMHGKDEEYLAHLTRVSKQNEDDDKEKAINRRVSMAATRTHTNMTDDAAGADPRQAAGTTQAADSFAEEEVAVLALDCLKSVFSTENRGQLRFATSAVLRYMADTQDSPKLKSSPRSAKDPSTDTWATKLFEICTAWTPVQDRFVSMVTTVETLVRLPLDESDLQKHLLYTDLIDHILRSDLNLVGLSVMDILLNLIQQILRVLQLNGPRVPGRGSATQLFSDDEDIHHPTTQKSEAKLSEAPSEARVRLIERLKHGAADLATHVYYTDQISDMISAILLRLKPNPASTGEQNPLITAAAIEEPKLAVNEVATNISVSAQERPGTTANDFFSFDSARTIALEIVRDVLLVSNSARSFAVGGVAESRNKTPISVWEGTQWLLRDPAQNVRRAYTDALTTWLELETKKADMRIKKPEDRAKHKSNGATARRAVSNASQRRNQQSKKATNTFLQLLHLAVFENALDFGSVETRGPAPDQEFLTLHFLLAKLVAKIGVNAIQNGLPMIFALQDELTTLDSPKANIRIGSLVYAYFWNLSKVYDLDDTAVGRIILTAVEERKQAGQWLHDLDVPPMALEWIFSSSFPNTRPMSPSTDKTVPFDQRSELVDAIADSYSRGGPSPSPSAPGSPGRSPTNRRLSVNGPALDRVASNYLSARPATGSSLPDKVKEAMLETWTRDGCLAAIAAAAPKSVSLSNSQSSPSQALISGNHRQLLATANAGPSPRGTSPVPAPDARGTIGDTIAQPRQQGFGPLLHSESPKLNATSSDPGRHPSSSTGAQGHIRVEDLKRVLAGGSISTAFISRVPSTRDSVASDSLVDVGCEDLGSESGGFVTPPSRVDPDAGVRALLPASIPEDIAVDHTAEARHTGQGLPTFLSYTDNAAPSLAPGLHDTGLPNGTFLPPPVLPVAQSPSRGAGGGWAGSSIGSKSGQQQSRKDLMALLAGIGGKEDSATGVEGAPPRAKKFEGSGRPPY